MLGPEVSAMKCLLFLLINHMVHCGWWGNDCLDRKRLCEWQNWHEWGACTRTCGGGTRTRSRGICCRSSWSWNECVDKCRKSNNDAHQTESCNTFCLNGVHYFGACNCPDHLFDDCCGSSKTYCFCYMYVLSKEV